MREQKGFTLIELLAVVLIIGMLLIIAIPAVSKYLTKGTNQYYSSLEDTIKLSGKDYIEDYRSLYPKEIGNVTVIELNELVGNHYIDEIVDEDGNTCDAKVTVKKTGKNQYEYYSCLLCKNYKTEGENCNYTEDNNVTSDSKNYTIQVPQNEYEVLQGENFTLPTAQAYYLGQLVSNNVTGSPRLIDTNKLGTTVVTYAYKGATKQITIKVVDKVKPSTPQVVLKYNNKSGKVYNGKWYSNDIYAEFQSTDYAKTGLLGSGISYYEISTDQQEWTKLSSNNYTHNIDGDKNYYIRSVDQAGNVSAVKEYNVKIDKQTPTCSIVVTGTEGINGWYKSNVTLELKITPTVSGVATQVLSPKSITDNTTGTKVTGSVTSNAGKVGSCPITVKVDKQTPAAPTITANDNITTGKWHKENTTLTVDGSSSTSGIDYYFDTKTNPDTKTTSVSINADTASTVYYAKACNGAGTCSDISNYDVKLDKQTPTCSIVVTGTEGSNKWYTTDVTLALQSTETISKISKSTISLDKITANTNGTEVTGTVTSTAGKVGTCTITVKVDKTKPTAPTITANDNITTGNWHQEDTTLTVSGSSSTSGIDYYFDTKANPTTKVTSASITADTASTIYYAKACNGAGTCSDISNYDVKLDKQTPACSIVVTGTEGSNKWYTTDVTLSLNTTPTISEIATQILSQESITSDTDGTKITGSVMSTAGKIGTCAVTVKVDKATPKAPTIAANDKITSGNWHKADTTLTVSGSSSTSGIDYYFDTKNNPDTKTTSLSITSNTPLTTYYAKACNRAGTCSSISNYDLKLDKTPPTAPTITGGNAGWVTTAPTISISTGGTAISGIKEYEYYTSSNSATPSTNVTVTGKTSNTVNISQEGSIYIWYRSVSNSGLKSEWSSPQVVHLDTKKPTITVSLNGKEATLTLKDNLQLSGYAVTDNQSVPNSWTTTNGTSQTYTYTATSAGTYYAHVKDQAGLTDYVDFTIDSSAFSYPAVETTYPASSSQQCSSWSACCPNARSRGCPSSLSQSTSGYHPDCYCNCNGITCWPLGDCCSGTTTVYSCPNGGTLNESTKQCYQYSCPDGGTLNGTVCER